MLVTLEGVTTLSIINLLLTDRCSVLRSTETIDDYGNAHYVTSTVATDLPCSYVRESYLDSYADVTGASNKSSGSFYASTEDFLVLPGDTVTLESGQKLSILPDGGAQRDYLSHPTHAEYAAKEVV